MILFKISSLKEAILHKCHLKATNWSAFYSGFSFLIICLACCSCGSTKVVPIETIHEVLKIDTIEVVQRDSIPYEVTITKTKEITRPLTWFDHLTRATFFLFLGAIVILVYRYVRKILP